MFFPLFSADGPLHSQTADLQGQKRKEGVTDRGKTNPYGAMQCYGKDSQVSRYSPQNTPLCTGTSSEILKAL